MLGALTLLFLDLHADVEVDGEHDQVRDQVEGAHAVENGRIIEWDLLRHLHPAPRQYMAVSLFDLLLYSHPEDDHEVRATRC